MKHQPLRIVACSVFLLAGGAPAARAHAQVAGFTGTLIVTNKSAATATIIDAASGRALATLPTGQGPHEIALSSNGNLAVVTDYGGGGGGGRTLTVIDVPGMRVARTIELGEYTRPHGIVFLPGDSIVAVTSEASRHVVLVNVIEGAVRNAVPTQHPGSHMVGVTADGVHAWTGDMGSHTISLLNLRTGSYVRSFTVPQQPEAINVTPDGSEVWVGSNAEDKVSVVDPQTGNVQTVAEGMGWPYRVAFTPDTRTVLLPDLEGETLRFVDRASRRELGRIAFTGGGPQGITITSDGRYAIESMSRQSRVAVIDIAARTVAGYIPAGPAPDGVVYTTRVLAR
jgi:DNA-binding beta-propeller fold protein YncE